jgi:hypothetical protein
LDFLTFEILWSSKEIRNLKYLNFKIKRDSTCDTWKAVQARQILSISLNLQSSTRQINKDKVLALGSVMSSDPMGYEVILKIQNFTLRRW